MSELEWIPMVCAGCKSSYYCHRKKILSYTEEACPNIIPKFEEYWIYWGK